MFVIEKPSAVPELGTRKYSCSMPQICRIVRVTMSHQPLSQEVPKDPAVRRAWIIFQLRIRGLSFRELGRRYGFSVSAFSHATLVPSYRIEKILARSIDLRIEELFPERYDAAGRRLPQIRRERSTARKSGNVYVGDAA